MTSENTIGAGTQNLEREKRNQIYDKNEEISDHVDIILLGEDLFDVLLEVFPI